MQQNIELRIFDYTINLISFSSNVKDPNFPLNYKGEIKFLQREAQNIPLP